MSSRVAIPSFACRNVNPNPHCSPPQHWPTCSISSHFLCVIEHVSKQTQVPRRFPSQEHSFSPGRRVILLPVPLTHILSKFTIKKLNRYNMRPNCLSKHVLSDDWYPPSENWGVLDSNPCPDFWVDNAQSPFFALFYIYILG